MESHHKQFDFSEPWDSPHNCNAMQGESTLYHHCPAATDKMTETNYFAVVDPRTGSWPPDHPMSLKDIKDGAL